MSNDEITSILADNHEWHNSKENMAGNRSYLLIFPELTDFIF